MDGTSTSDVIAAHDADGDGQLNFAEFSALVRAREPGQIHTEAELRQRLLAEVMNELGSPGTEVGGKGIERYAAITARSRPTRPSRIRMQLN